MKKNIYLIGFILLNLSGFGQSLNNFTEKEIVVFSDSIRIDTLSIVPESFSAYFENKIISVADYEIDYAKAILFFKKDFYPEIKDKKIHIEYRVFPYNFSKPVYKKYFNDSLKSIKRKYNNNYFENDLYENTGFSGLKKSGSISRGIVLGNNQNAGLISDFNLQLSGKINNDIEINADITDNNIPIQADGTSQNLKEFDNVFITVKTKNSILTAGDFIAAPYPDGYFVQYKRKVKGTGFETKFNTEKYDVKTKINASVSKGKYNRIKFNGIEGNQGPYKLTGKDGELYIVVLSGSEKIYIDGVLMKRGNNNDYVINYNTGELTFTSERIITKDSRITAEFEYSDMNYVRFNAGAGAEIKNEKTSFFVNFFSEQDAKNQPLRQELSPEQKNILANAGDDIANAFVPNVVLLDTFNNNEILYKKTDTAVNGVFFENIYVYSVNETNARYRAIFSYVGENKGNYVRDVNAANGKVYKWVFPENGIPQGEYEPVKLLVTPKKKQMINAGAKGVLKNNTKYYFETALSAYDINTFSGIDDDDNLAFALKGGFEQSFLKKDSSEEYLILKTDYSFVDKNFNEFDPYRPVEFNRDWNLANITEARNEHFAALNLTYFKKEKVKAGINSSFLQKNNYYNGNKNEIFFQINKSKFLTEGTFSRLTTNDIEKKSEFIRYKSKIEKKIGKINIGVNNSGEKNLLNLKNNDTIPLMPFRFHELETYIKTSGKKNNDFSLSYVNREDFTYTGNRENYVSTAHNLKFKSVISGGKHQKIKTVINFRKLNLKENNENGENGNSLSGKTDYSLNVLKNGITSSIFVEHLTGREPVKEFAYIEVQNGKGVFAWKDFNDNGIKELNEFVKAQFEDEANFIRTAIPSSEYQNVYNQTFYQVLNIYPKRIFDKSKKIFNPLSFFSFRITYKLNRKINNENSIFDFKLADTVFTAFNKNFKNRVLFRYPKFNLKISYNYIDNQVRNLLINGTDTKRNNFHSLEIYKKNGDFIITNNSKKGNKENLSEYFSDNNYFIDYFENETYFTYKADKKNTLKTGFIFKNKKNTSGEETLKSYTLSGEYENSDFKTGSFRINFDFVNINYTGNKNTFISYEMLEGLNSGKNYLLSVKWYKKISDNIQLELNYSGRKNGENKIIHFGGMSIRAFL